ncbi:MAG: DUF11 domain-containing protein [Trichocoleus desertorum ATA4-8-CV12]|jgi:uncharacterized repeat protein (TIGR01451 family)|nr:DUF11 domain-containing protein [Trichocoleus desertorum ATA4-8-CV12]
MKLQRFPNLKLLAPAALTLAGATLGITTPAIAAPQLTITPITWNVIGLDSVASQMLGGAGPDQFLEGARVCNVGDTTATNVTASFVKTGGSSYIGLFGASTLSIPSLPAGTTSLPPGNTGPTPSNCSDFYFNVKIARDRLAYSTLATASTRQQFYISATATGLGTITTPQNRELYVEKLVSQSRNAVDSISGPSTVFVGDIVQYTVKGHTAPGGYEQLSFLPVLPGFFQLLSVSTTYSSPSGSTNNVVYADACGWENNPSSTYYHNNLTCDNPSIPSGYVGEKVGDNVTTVYTIKILSAGSGALTNIIYDFSGSSYHYNADVGTGANLFAVTAFAPSAGIDLMLQKTRVSTFANGINGQYTLNVSNAGTLSTTGTITVTDVLPTSLEYVSASGSGWTCGYNGTNRTVTCTSPGPLASKANSNITLTVKPNTTGTISNTAEVITANDIVSANNKSTDTTTVNAPVNLAVTKTVGLTGSSATPITSASPNSNITYTLKVANNSGFDITGAKLSDIVDPAITVSTTPTPTCNPSGGSTCTLTVAGNDISALLNLKSGGTAIITITGTVAPSATGTIPNTAQVAPPTGYVDQNLADNTASADVNVSAPDLTITKTHTDKFLLDQNSNFILTVKNIGFAATSGTITVTDQLPTGLTYQSATGTGWTCSFNATNTTVTCTTSNAIAASSSGNPITITVRRDSSAAVVNTAMVAGGGDKNTTNDLGSDAIAGISQVRLVKRITAINTTSRTGFIDGPGNDDIATNWPSPTSTSLQGVVNGGAVRSGDEVEYTIYFLSDGGADAQSVVLCDLVPLNQTLVTNAYSTVTAGSGGTAGATRSIATSVNGAQVSYTDLVDRDAGGFYAVGASVPLPTGGTSPQPCPATNTSTNGNGAVMVNLGTLPRATAPGTPAGSYGFVRFRAKVN